MPGYIKRSSLVLFLLFNFVIFISFLPAKVLAAYPLGFIESNSDCNQLNGWAGDTDNPNLPIDVHFYYDGQWLGATTANSPREPAVCETLGGQSCSVCPANQPQCKHAFFFTVPPFFKDGQQHQIKAYGIDINAKGDQTNDNKPINNDIPITLTCSQGDTTISSSFDGSPITIKTASKWAGAIDSMTWRGKEFVFSVNNGQQIQVALTPNNWGQCYNPTESGAAKDEKGPSTSSKLLAFSAHDNQIETTNRMAFWLDPAVNPTDPGCIMRKNPSYANGPWWPGFPLNNSVLSDFILHKKITIGYKNLPNVIIHEATVDAPAI